MIKLVPVSPHLLTSYGPNGVTREFGRPVRKPLSVRQAGGAKVWKLSAQTAVDLDGLCTDVLEAGGAPLRLTECYRDQVHVQAPARRKYLSWVNAGKPARIDPKRMKNAYVAPPNQSNHGWGGAIDFDVDALEFPGTGVGTDEALYVFWGMAAARGFLPIIREANIDQSESWHFDHLGHLRLVYSAFHESEERNPYGATAEVGCALAMTSDPPTEQWQRWLQAYLVLAWVEGVGPSIGRVDGKVGAKTRAAIRKLLDVDYNPADIQRYVQALVDDYKVGSKVGEFLL